MEGVRICVINDDGIFSPGLAAAVETARKYGEVSVIAPSRQKTGAGRSLMGRRDQAFEQIDLKVEGKVHRAYHIDCTPALVLKHALDTVLRGKTFDLVISGINYGENMGYDITVSGTIGAAMQAAVEGIPAFAVSLQTHIENHFSYGKLDWAVAQHFLGVFIKKFIEKGPFRGFEIMKIDVPEEATPETEWKVTSLSRKQYFRTSLDNGTPDTKLTAGKLIRDEYPHQEGTDAYTLLVEKKVAVNPLTLDFTAHSGKEYFD